MVEQKHNISWKDELELHVPLMDCDHSQMLSLINDVYAAYDRHQWDASVKAAMANLSLFTVQHFNREEALMRELKYSGFMAHYKAHQKLTSVLDAITQRIDHDGPAGIDDTDMVFLHKWLVKHIHGADRKLASFCRREQVKGA